MMYRSFPRYWMVAIASLVMITTLGVEYLRLVLHPIDHTGGFHKRLHSELTPEPFESQPTHTSNRNSEPYKSQFQQSIPETLTGSVASYGHESLSVNATTSPSSLTKYEAESRPVSVIHTKTVESIQRGAMDRHLMQSLPDDDGKRDQGKRTQDHFKVQDSPILPQKKTIQKRKYSKRFHQKYKEHRPLQNGNDANRPPVAAEAHNIVDGVLRKKQPTSGNIMNWHQRNVSQSILSHPKLTEKEKQWIKLRRYHARNKRVRISRDLLRLGGISLPPSSSLQDRGFPLWHNNSVVASHLPSLLLALRKIGVDGISNTTWSLNPDIIARGHFQQEQVRRFCNEHSSALPSDPEALSELFSHLLYDDSKKIVFCYVPKNGCSNMKRLMLILNGILPPESAQWSRPSEVVLRKAKSFRNLTVKEALYKLQNYFKFSIIRNPLERLLSAYRNKLEHPVVYAERKYFPNDVQLFIMSLFRPKQVHAWLDSPVTERHVLFPSFKEFVTYMKMFPLSDYNEHFSPFTELCHPCSIRYDFYANFKSMDYDLGAVIDYLSIPSSYYPLEGINRDTQELMNDYYTLLSWKEKKDLFDALQMELDFYYSLYPEESNFHEKLLLL